MTPQDFLESVVEAEPRRMCVFYIYLACISLFFLFFVFSPFEEKAANVKGHRGHKRGHSNVESRFSQVVQES